MKRIKQIVMMAFASLLAQCVWAEGTVTPKLLINFGSTNTATGWDYYGETGVGGVIPANVSGQAQYITSSIEGSSATCRIADGSGGNFFHEGNSSAGISQVTSTLPDTVLAGIKTDLGLGDGVTLDETVYKTGLMNGGLWGHIATIGGLEAGHYNVYVGFGMKKGNQLMGFSMAEGQCASVGTLEYYVTVANSGQNTPVANEFTSLSLGTAVRPGDNGLMLIRMMDVVPTADGQIKFSVSGERGGVNFIAISKVESGAALPENPDYTYNGHTYAHTGWFTGPGENCGNDRVAIGPGNMGTVGVLIDGDGTHHPWTDAKLPEAFTLATFMDLSMVDNATATSKAVVWSTGDSGSDRIMLLTDGENVILSAAGGDDISLPLPTPGYHLYTAVFSTEGITLVIDNGGENKVATKSATYNAVAAHFQIGAVHTSTPSGYCKPHVLPIAKMIGYSQTLSEAQIDLLALENTPTAAATGNINYAVQGGKLYAGSITHTDARVEIDRGTLIVPAGKTYSVPALRFGNSQANGENGTFGLELDGTLTISGGQTTDGSGQGGVRSDVLNNRGGILGGEWEGKGTYNIRGTLDARNSFVQLVHDAHAQVWNVENGGVFKVKAFEARTSSGKDRSSHVINIKNGGQVISTQGFTRGALTANVEAGGVLELAATANTSMQANDLSKITGNGQIKFSGTTWISLPSGEDKMFASTLEVVNNSTGNGGGLLFDKAVTYTIGPMSGNGEIRFDANDVGARTLKIVQSKDTTWTGNIKSMGSSTRSLNIQIASDNDSIFKRTGQCADTTSYFTVDAGATLNLGSTNGGVGNTVILNGGKLISDGVGDAHGRIVKNLTLAADSAFEWSGTGAGIFGVGDNAQDSKLDLANHKLTLTGKDSSTRVYLDKVTSFPNGGTIEVTKGRLFIHCSSITAPENTKIVIGENASIEADSVTLSVPELVYDGTATTTAKDMCVVTVTSKFSGSGSIPKLTLGDGAEVSGSATVTTTATANGTVKLMSGTLSVPTAFAANMVVSGDETKLVKLDGTTYSLWDGVAKIGTTPYATVQDAINHLAEGQTVADVVIVDATATIPTGYAKVTTGDVVTLRQIGGKVYYKSGDWTDGCTVWADAEHTSTTTFNVADTMVLDTDNTVVYPNKNFSSALKIEIAAGITAVIGHDNTFSENLYNVPNNSVITLGEGAHLGVTFWNNATDYTPAFGTVTINGGTFGVYNVTSKAINAGTIKGTSQLVLNDGETITVSGSIETTPTSGVEHKHVVQNGTTYSLAMDQVTISVPSIDNTTVAVTGGMLADNAVVVDYGTAVTVTYTANENYKLVGGDGVYTFDGTADGTAGEGLSAVLDVTTITIPDAPANTVVKVTVNGNPVTVENNTITATIGATVVVTYSAAEGYIMDDVVTEFTASTTAPTIAVPTEAPVQAVAKIGETLYPTLAAAFAVGGEVTLLQNTVETLTVAAGKTVTLDINGKVVKSQANTITVKGTLVVNNTAEKGAIMSVTSGKSAITTSGSGKFTINGGTIDAVGTAVSGMGTINGGTIISSGSFAVYANSSSGSIEITGGTITGAAAKGDVGVYTGNVKVTGATLANGIKFASNASGIILAGTDTTLFTPEVGIYEGETLVGYAPAQTTGTISAMAGKTVKLLKDCTTTDYLTIGKSCTLDLNGHNLTTSAAAAIVVKGSSTTPSVVTITGSGKVSSTAADCNAVQIGAYATVTIAGGEYVVPTDNAAVYIASSYAAKPSTVAITGGSFASGDGKYVLNIKDDQVARGAAISVTGGTFKGFDPSNCISEGAGTNFVADGYISIAEGANFVVAKKGAAVDPTPTTDGVAITIPVGGATVEVDGETTSTIPNTTGKHTVVIKDSTGKVIRADEVGVVNVEKTTVSTTHAVAVPFKGKTVATLLNTALLDEGDTLMAWVTVGEKSGYATWKLTSGAWVGENVVNGIAAQPATTALKCGQAVWVTTAGQVVTFGDVNAQGAVVEIGKGHNLLGSIAYTAAEPSAIDTDQVQLIGEVDAEGNEVITRYNKTSTGWVSKIQKRIDVGNGVSYVKEETSNEVPKVKPGRGYWLIRK